MKNFNFNFEAQEWMDLQIVLRELWVKTNCFADAKVIRAGYLVAIDDDPVSAYLASKMYHQIHKTHGYYPQVLCVGGFGKLSKVMNNGLSEGQKLAYVCECFGVRAEDIVILDKGTNTGHNARDVAKHILEKTKKLVSYANRGVRLSDLEFSTRIRFANKPVIFCVTQRLSWRLERTIKFLPQQFSDLFKLSDGKDFELKDYYYCPEQKLEEMLTPFNGKIFAGGIMLLAEVASIYDRYHKTKGRFMKEAEQEISNSVIAASKRLATRFPLKNPGLNIRKLWQYPYAYMDIVNHKLFIQNSFGSWICEHQKKINAEFGLSN